MKGTLLCAATLVVLFLAIVLVPSARADLWNQKIEVRFSEAVAIPGQVLPAGTYWFVLANTQDRNMVQIFNVDWSKLYATLDTVPDFRWRATNRTELTFAERPHDQPQAILAWFYPGMLTGHEFLYPGAQAKRLEADIHQAVLAPNMRGSQPETVTTPGE